ncbi:hypothetical protein AX16_005485 [Volvariella volvacea WC 439]|nr:hypothetical protein AX16_005485 [Volvariella volvacea WC 439]
MSQHSDLPPGLSPSTEVWFTDGNVILHAGATAFRVYRGLLAARSTFFFDLFALSGRAKDEACHNGHPVIELYDSPEELSHFLRAIFDARFFEPYPVKYPIDTIFDILNLSMKYDVSYLRRRCLRHLSSFVPESLQVWRDQMVDYAYLSLDKLGPKLIRIAKEFDYTWLLVHVLVYAVFYEILRQNVMLGGGNPDDAAQLNKIPPLITNEQLMDGKSKWRTKLQAVEIEEGVKAQLLEAWEPIIRLLSGYSLVRGKANVWATFYSHCLSPSVCRDFWLEGLADHQRGSVPDWDAGNAFMSQSNTTQELATIQFLRDGLRPQEGDVGPLCAQCQTILPVVDKDASEGGIREMPKIFGSRRDWGELLEAAGDAMRGD